MDKENRNFIREMGNHLMAEFDELLYLMADAISESTADLNSKGEESVNPGLRKYDLLNRILGLAYQTREDYVYFCNSVSVEAPGTDWEFPFDDQFMQVDLEWDHTLVDKFFDENIRKTYQKIRKCREYAKNKLFEEVGKIFYRCPCCLSTLFAENGDYDICPLCKWENDKVQNEDPGFAGGANEESLAQARNRLLEKSRRMP